MKQDDIEPAAFAPGSFGCHEAVHMTSFLAASIELELCEHPSIKQNRAWKALADQAANTLAKLYHDICAAHLPAPK